MESLKAVVSGLAKLTSTSERPAFSRARSGAFITAMHSLNDSRCFQDRPSLYVAGLCPYALESRVRMLDCKDC